MKREPEGIACSFRMKDPSNTVEACGKYEEVFFVMGRDTIKRVLLHYTVIYRLRNAIVV